jgi:hypothetical protein
MGHVLHQDQTFGHRLRGSEGVHRLVPRLFRPLVVLKKTAAGSWLGRSLVKAFASFGVARLYSTIPRAWPS